MGGFNILTGSTWQTPPFSAMRGSSTANLSSESDDVRETTPGTVKRVHAKVWLALLTNFDTFQVFLFLSCYLKGDNKHIQVMMN